MRELQEERAMNKSLQENQSVWQEKVAKLESRVKEINETKSQVSIYIYCIYSLFKLY